LEFFSLFHFEITFLLQPLDAAAGSIATILQSTPSEKEKEENVLKCLKEEKNKKWFKRNERKKSSKKRQKRKKKI
jgi:hypothetical protein